MTTTKQLPGAIRGARKRIRRAMVHRDETYAQIDLVDWLKLNRDQKRDVQNVAMLARNSVQCEVDRAKALFERAGMSYPVVAKVDR